jgi:hypothetical protein
MATLLVADVERFTRLWENPPDEMGALGMTLGQIGCYHTEAPARPTGLPWDVHTPFTRTRHARAASPARRRIHCSSWQGDPRAGDRSTGYIPATLATTSRSWSNLLV